jgi:signal transduction histidine kinase/ligand-binding sensor domain-containing protein
MPRWIVIFRNALFLAAIFHANSVRSANASSSEEPAPRHPYDVWPLDGNWQPNTVTTTIQTRAGYLWLGTYNGLVRFDGVSLKVFDSGNTDGLKNSRITSLYEDDGGIMWIGHETGELTRFAGHEFQPMPLPSTWPGGAIETIETDEKRDLWLVNDRGVLLRLRDGRIAEAPGGGATGKKAMIAREVTGRMWIAANGQVATLIDGKVVPFAFNDSADGDFYAAVLPSRDGALWVVRNGGVWKYRRGHWEPQLTNAPGAQTPATAMLETRDGTLLVGTLSDGLYWLMPGAAPLHFTRTNGLSHDWVRAVCEDHEGNIWVGTGAGLDTLRPRKVNMINLPGNGQGKAVLSFTTQRDGTAWIGTEGAGLYRYGGGQWTNYAEASGLNNLFIWSVCECGGDLLIGSWGGGLLAKEGERFVARPEFEVVGGAIVSLFEGRHGELWVGTPTGVYRFENHKLTWSAGKDRLELCDVRAIAETSDGTVWFGMLGGGLGSLQHGMLTQLRKGRGMTSDFVQCLYADHDGTLWIGTADVGLARLKNGKITRIGSAQGLPSEVMSHIVDDEAGNLWIGARGIIRASKDDLNRCADGLVPSVSCLVYGRAEGLASSGCSGGFQPGARKAPDGSLWFPTAKGLAIIDPFVVTTNRAVPPIVIEELLVDGKPVEAKSPHGKSRGQVIKIPPGNQRFQIRYTGLSFAAPSEVRFKYKLEGLEKEWVEARTGRSADYSYLQPGAYTFHVIGCNNDGLWNESGATLAFTVMPAFWQTWWFRVGAVGAGAALVSVVALSLARRRLRARMELLERQRGIERERSRIARDIHDDLGASLTHITMLSQSVRGELSALPQAAADMDQIYGTARELTRAMDEIVWAVNPKHDTLDSLVTYLGRYAQNFLSHAGIRCRIDVPVQLPNWVVTAEIRHNVFLAVKEALNNVVKHAQASEARISLEMLPHGFLLLISDNGCGFYLNGGVELPAGHRDFGVSQSEESNPTERDAEFDRAGNVESQRQTRIAAGNGLSNMRRRLEEVGGRCEWDTAPGEGTRVRLMIAIKT